MGIWKVYIVPRKEKRSQAISVIKSDYGEFLSNFHITITLFSQFNTLAARMHKAITIEDIIQLYYADHNFLQGIELGKA